MILQVFTFLHAAAFGDFAIAVIVILLGALVGISERGRRDARNAYEKNEREHDIFSSNISDLNSWRKTTFEDVIKPTKDLATQNEKQINKNIQKIAIHEIEINNLKKAK